MADPGTDRELRHPDEDVLLDAALGAGDPQTRAEVGEHLVACARCRLSYDELAGAIERVLPAVPRSAPPPDFVTSVLTRLDQAHPAALVSPAPRKARRWLVPVAAGLIGLAAGGGLTALVLQPASQQEVSLGTAIVTGDGTRVGSVTRTIAAGAPALVVALDDGPMGVSYTCRLVLEDGSVQDVGDWALRADGVNSWVVPDPGARRVELVTTSGAVWSSADL